MVDSGDGGDGDGDGGDGDSGEGDGDDSNELDFEMILMNPDDHSDNSTGKHKAFHDHTSNHVFNASYFIRRGADKNV